MASHHDPQAILTPPDRLRGLLDLSGRALRGDSLDDVFGHAAEQLVALVPAKRAAVFETIGSEQGQHLKLRAGSPGRAWSDDIAAPGTDEQTVLGALQVARGVAIPFGVQQPFGVVVVETEAAEGISGDERTFIGEVAELLAAAVDRKMVEEDLRSSEQRLAMAQRIAHMGSYDWHIASNTNAWSDELYRIYGTEPQSFNASYERFLSFIHPDDRDEIAAIHSRAYETGEPFEMEERIVRPDGEERILRSNGEVITDEDGKPVRMVGICFDVTEQRRAEEQARRYHDSEVARRQAFELNDSVVQGLATVVHALEAERDELALEASRRTLRAARSMMNDLLEMATDEDLEPGHLVRSSPPVTVLPEAVAAPPTAPAKVRMVVADDSEDMRMMLRLGIGAEPGFEVVGEAAEGEEAIDLVDDHRPDVILLDLAMPKMDGLEVIKLIKERSPGTKIVVLSGFDAERMRPLALQQGADAYVEKGVPLVELKATVSELVPEVETPDHGSAVDAGSLLGTLGGPELLAHELRTPVTVIESLVGTVKGRTERLPSSAVDELFGALGRNAEQLRKLLDDFEDVLRLGDDALTLRHERTRIPALVHSVVQDLGSLLGSRRVRMQLGRDLVADADQFRLRQILSNLVSNAAKFSPDGSVVTIVARGENGDVVVTVSDEGPGIPPERRHELFQRFSRLGAGGQGLGLGLALARGLARAHGGDLTLLDTAGQGAAFELRIPARKPDPAEA